MMKNSPAPLLLALVHLAPAMVLPAAPSCRHQPAALHTSSWRETIAAGVLFPVWDANNVNIENLQNGLHELVAVINLKKNVFARDSLHQSYATLDLTYGEVGYEAELGLAPQAPDWDSRVRAAYDTFQRLALVLEVVRVDHRHHGSASARTEQLWRRVVVLVDRALEQLHQELVAGREVPAPLARGALPDWLRCMEDSVHRDTRDFLVLRHVLRAATAFVE